MSSGAAIWVDVTDLSIWKGHFTGTQRVTYEMAVRFYEQTPSARFFGYDERGRKFYEIDFAQIMATIVQSQQGPVEPVRKQGFHRPSVKGVARAQSLRVYRNLPFRIKQQLTPARKDKLKNMYHTFRKLSGTVITKRQQLSKARVNNDDSVTFAAHDAVVLLGKPWDTPTFVDVLRDQKQNQHFKVFHLIYDMIPVFLPHTFGKPLPEDYTRYMFEALGLADHVFAISESTKRDVLKFCKEELLVAPPISVLRLGDSVIDIGSLGEDDSVSGVKPESFILCVGTIEVRKNHALLYAAYKEAAARGIEMPDLVIVGGKGWYTGDILYQFKHDPDLKHKVRIIHGISDKQVAWLYLHSLFTIYPSVYEGWGLPIAESLAYGKVCIASNASSMTEIAGGLLDYFSPYDSVGCLDLIAKYLVNDVRAKKEQAIRKAYTPYTWDQTFGQITRVVST